MNLARVLVQGIRDTTFLMFAYHSPTLGEGAGNDVDCWVR